MRLGLTVETAPSASVARSWSMPRFQPTRCSLRLRAPISSTRTDSRPPSHCREPRTFPGARSTNDSPASIIARAVLVLTVSNPAADHRAAVPLSHAPSQKAPIRIATAAVTRTPQRTTAGKALLFRFCIGNNFSVVVATSSATMSISAVDSGQRAAGPNPQDGLACHSLLDSDRLAEDKRRPVTRGGFQMPAIFAFLRVSPQSDLVIGPLFIAWGMIRDSAPEVKSPSRRRVRRRVS